MVSCFYVFKMVLPGSLENNVTHALAVTRGHIQDSRSDLEDLQSEIERVKIVVSRPTQEWGRRRVLSQRLLFLLYCGGGCSVVKYVIEN